MELPPSASQAMYDDRDRSLIRRKLIAHMRRCDIGAPRLQFEIARVTGRTVDELPRSTLQRFIRGVPKNTRKASEAGKAMRTNDAVVFLIQKFLLEVNETDPVEEYGEAASKFYDAASIDRILELPAGNYVVSTFRYEPTGILKDQLRAVHAHLEFERVADGPFCRVSETSYRTAATQGEVPADRRINAEGIAFSKSGSLTLLMRDLLSRNHISYVLELDRDPEGDGTALKGILTAAEFDGVTRGTFITHGVRLTHQEEEAA